VRAFFGSVGASVCSEIAINTCKELIVLFYIGSAMEPWETVTLLTYLQELSEESHNREKLFVYASSCLLLVRKYFF
jgi:hypothetical protein